MVLLHSRLTGPLISQVHASMFLVASREQIAALATVVPEMLKKQHKWTEADDFG